MSFATSTENLRRRVRAWATARWARVAMVAVAAALLLGAVVPYFLDADPYRGTISNLIAERTGRQIRFGKIRAQVLPHVGFSVEDAHMGNPSGFAPGEFVAAQEVRGALAFWPLVLRREIRLTSLEMVKPKLLLLEDGRGHNNYTFSSAAPSAVAAVRLAQAFPGAPEGSDANAGAGTSTLEVDALSLRDAEVMLGNVDARGNITATIDATGLSGELRHWTLEPFAVRDWQGDAELAGSRVTFASWNGPIALSSGSVRLRGGELESVFVVDVGKGTRVQGKLSVADVEHAVVRFDLQTANLDLDALLAGLPKMPAERNRADAAGEPRAILSSATDQAPNVGDLLAVGHVAADKIRVKPYVAGPLTADVRLYADRAEIWPFTLRLEGGSLQATARTDQRQKPARFSVKLEARNIDVARLLQSSPALRGALAGTGELDLQMFGSFDAAWALSLEGQGHFAVRNGRIKGFNLIGAAQSIANLAGGSGDTTFVAVTGDLGVHQGRVNSRDVHLNSPRGTVDLRGWCGLDGTLEYDGQIGVQVAAPAPPAQAGASAQPAPAAADGVSSAIGKLLAKNAGVLTLPISLRGTLAHPALGPGHGGQNFPAPAKPNPQKKDSFPNLFQK